jgi:hypothetical protein
MMLPMIATLLLLLNTCVCPCSMIEVEGVDRKSGQRKRHQVKSLSLVWRRLPQFGPHNTFHVDDLGRNFALNPANGIKIKAYREDMCAAHMLQLHFSAF